MDENVFDEFRYAVIDFVRDVNDLFKGLLRSLKKKTTDPERRDFLTRRRTNGRFALSNNGVSSNSVARNSRRGFRECVHGPGRRFAI